MPQPISNAYVRDLDRRYVFHSWSTQGNLDPLVIAGGQGCRLWDHDGREYLDFSSQLVFTNLGHQHPKVVAAIQAQAARPSGVSHVIAIKQLYATHYFQTTLELRFLVRDEQHAGRPGFYLVSITRSRIDGTGGLTGALLRAVISRRSRSAVRGYLEHLKRQVERGPSDQIGARAPDMQAGHPAPPRI